VDKKFSDSELDALWARVEPLIDAMTDGAVVPDSVAAAQAIVQSNGDAVPIRDVARKLIILDARGDISAEECRALLAYV